MKKNSNYNKVDEQLLAAQILYEANLGEYSQQHLQTVARLLSADTDVEADDEVMQRIQATDWPASAKEFRQHWRYLKKQTKQKPILIYPPQVRRWTYEAFGLILVVLLLVSGSGWVETIFFKKYVPGWTSGDEGSYHNPVAVLGEPDRGAFFWAEFGNNNQLLSYRIANSAYKIKTTGFEIGHAWKDRDVSWYMKSADRGTITLTFPANTPMTNVMVYMTDGDSFWRMSHMDNEYAHVNASALRNGRWYTFDLHPKEIAEGKFQLNFYKIMGLDVAVSALVVMYDEKGF